MASDAASEVKLEIGHVLFIDIVEYSKLLITQQSEQLQTLRKIVRGTEQFRAAEAEGKLIRLPTGDGGALVFRTSPEAPVLCALEMGRELKQHPELRVRMGIHSGPVNEVTDLNEQANVAGAGINIAKRVMDCGDASHILLSKHVAEDLEHYPRWRPYLHDLGECEVKHGLRVSVVNFYTDEVGNPALPEKFRSALPPVEETRLKRPKQVVPVTIGIGALTAIGILAWLIVPGMLRSRENARQGEQPPAAAESAPAKSIAILPFENLSDEKANAYFAEGVQDEILTRLAAVRDLKVISRTSTAKYQSKPDNLKTVAQELGVSTVLEGAVQRAGNKVRVNVQLIDARTDTHLWAKSYDRDFKDVLAVESEVSQEIAEALQANLSPNESQVLAAVRTPDSEAYDLFLRGEYELRQAENSRTAEAYDRADAFYRQALARDPNFVEAAAELARSRLSRHWFVSPLTPPELDEVKSIIDRALAIAPDSPQAHFALGVFFYWGHRQYEKALTEFNRTLELQPNNASARLYCAAVYRRRGEWERSLADSQRAQELDPRDPQIPDNIGATYLFMRQWRDAERAETRALAVDPHNTEAARVLARIRLNATGDIDSARGALDGFPEAITSLTREWFAAGEVAGFSGIWVYLDVIERRFTDAFQALEKKTVSNDLDHLQQLVARAALGVLAGEPKTAKSAGEEALPLLEARLGERPDDTFAMTQLSWVYLALGRNADALRLSRQAADLVPIEKDAVAGPLFQNGLAQIEARTGAPDEAVKRLRHLLSIPAGQVASITRLKIDPVWDPIRSRPDFQQLLSGPEQIGPNK